MDTKPRVDGGGSFGYVIPSLSFDYKLRADGRLVLATKWKGHINLGNDFEFYQGASIGGIDGLRGFRNQRFTGKRSFYQNTDVRLSLGKVKTGILPTALGLYGGFDYGRVWESGNASNVWHTSYGGGLFLNMTDLLSARVALFNSEDGLRFSFGLGIRVLKAGNSTLLLFTTAIRYKLRFVLHLKFFNNEFTQIPTLGNADLYRCPIVDTTVHSTYSRFIGGLCKRVETSNGKTVGYLGIVIKFKIHPRKYR